MIHYIVEIKLTISDIIERGEEKTLLHIFRHWLKSEALFSKENEGIVISIFDNFHFFSSLIISPFNRDNSLSFIRYGHYISIVLWFMYFYSHNYWLSFSKGVFLHFKPTLFWSIYGIIPHFSLSINRFL